MNKEKMKGYNKNMRSALDNGDYRSAQRTSKSFVGELLTDFFNGIGNIFKNRREAKERERERQEQLRKEIEAAQRRKKIIKILLIVMIIAGTVICGILLLKNVFGGKPDTVTEKPTFFIENESLTGKDVENEEIFNDSADKKPSEKIINLTKKDFFANELFIKIAGIPQSTNLLYIIGYSIFVLWLGLGGLFLISTLLLVIIALFKWKYWRKVGSGLLSSLLVFVSIIIQYYSFNRILERSLTEVAFSNALTVLSFALFIFSNITIIVLLRAKNKKARWGTVFKMIITIIVIYIPVIILLGKY
jgi:hypothetical protein